MKIFDLYETKEVKVEDPSLRRYINLDERIMIKSHGRERVRFSRSRVNVIERLIGCLSVPGHRGKKAKIMTNWTTGKWNRNARTVIEALTAIEKRTKQNPVQILVKAIENAAPRDEITTIEYGGARYPQAVDTAPTRRLSLAIRNLVHGAYDKAFNKKLTIAEALANELIAASDNSNDAFAISKKNETEKMADSAR